MDNAATAVRIVLFEDHLLSDMNPIALTRPAFAVTCACSRLYDIAAEAGGAPGVGGPRLSRQAGGARFSRQPHGGRAEVFPQRLHRP